MREYQKELCKSLNWIDVGAARVAAAKYDVLREPLIGLGIDL